MIVVVVTSTWLWCRGQHTAARRATKVVVVVVEEERQLELGALSLRRRLDKDVTALIRRGTRLRLLLGFRGELGEDYLRANNTLLVEASC